VSRNRNMCMLCVLAYTVHHAREAGGQAHQSYVLPRKDGRPWALERLACHVAAAVTDGIISESHDVLPSTRNDWYAARRYADVVSPRRRPPHWVGPAVLVSRGPGGDEHPSPRPSGM
jgi:hypothetical protein